MIDNHSHRSQGVIVGVDTHKDQHVAAVVDRLGALIGQRSLPTTSAGYVDLEHWAGGLGEIDAFGVEGTGSYGAGLARFLRTKGHRVVEVNRPDRSTRRRLGKSDTTDAEMAARAVLAGVAHDQPKSGVAEVEMIRMLKSTKDSAMKGPCHVLRTGLPAADLVKPRETVSSKSTGARRTPGR